MSGTAASIGIQMIPLKRLLRRIEQGWSPECENRPAELGEWGVMKAGCCNFGRFNAGDTKALPAGIAPRQEWEVKRGDLLMCRASGSPEHVGAVALVGEVRDRLLLSDKTFRLRYSSARVDPRFLAYALSSTALRQQIEVVISGAEGLANNLPQSALKELRVPCPPRAHQEQIASFLDDRLSEVDSLLLDKQRVIELLAEKQRALITTAVTTGLVPGAHRKSSGIPGIAGVPAHWRVERNKVFWREVYDRSVTGQEELLTVSHITGVTRRSEKSEVSMFLAETMEGYKRCSVDDLAINTMWAWMGALGVAPIEGIVSPSYNVYRLRRPAEHHARYFDLLYRTPPYVAEINRWSKGIWSSRLRLYPQEFLSMLCLVPPREEQERIVDYVTGALAQDEGLLSLLGTSIEKLRLYRQALITAAVTGKIDLSKEAA